MAVKIRLKRIGKIRQPYYRVVVVDSRKKRDGRVIEEIGIYHPKNDPSVIQVEGERARYWLGVGAQPSEAVLALLKLTGDWQQFKGEDAPPALLVAEPPKSKEDLFNEALKAVGAEPKAGATTAKKTSKKGAKVEETKAETDKTEPEKTEEVKAEAEKADKGADAAAAESGNES